MGRGFLAGSFWGLLIGAAVVALTSQLTDYRDLRPPAVADAAPGPGTAPGADDGVAVAAADGDTPVADGTATQPEVPSTDTAEVATDAPDPVMSEAEPAEQPAAPGSDTAPSTEVAETEAAPEADAPDALADAGADAAPADPVAPEAPDVTVVEAPEAPATDDATLPETRAEAPQPEGGAAPTAMADAPTADTPIAGDDVTRAAPPNVPSQVAGLSDAPTRSAAPNVARGTDSALTDQVVAMVVAPPADAPVTSGLDAPDEPVAAAAPALSTPPKPAPRTDRPATESADAEGTATTETDQPAETAEAPADDNTPPAAPEASTPVVVADAQEATPEAPAPEPETIAEADDTTAPPAAPDSDQADSVAAATPEVTAPEEDSGTDVIEIIRRGGQTEDEQTPAPAEPVIVEVTPDADSDAGGEDIAMAPATEEPGIVQPESRTVGNLADNVRVGRLVTIGDDAEAAPEAEVEEAAVEVETAVPEEGGGNALRQNASAFEAPDGLPILSVVLIHEGSIPNLDTFPVPVSYAVDASRPGAADLARSYRAAGREVVLIPNLPARASPGDVEQALQINLGQIPQAVALMDLPSASFQSSRAAIAQVVAAAAETGHGVVTFPRGLNSAQQLADRSGVSAAVVFRDIDGDGQPSGAISRSLDQAVLRARPGQPVILVGRTRPDTLRALADWAQGSRAASVALAPVSTALLSQ